jgi:hypothetical protein
MVNATTIKSGVTYVTYDPGVNDDYTNQAFSQASALGLNIETCLRNRDFSAPLLMAQQYRQKFPFGPYHSMFPEYLAGQDKSAYSYAMGDLSDWVKEHGTSTIIREVGIPACVMTALNGERYEGQSVYCKQQLKAMYCNEPGYDDSWVTDDAKSIGVAALMVFASDRGRVGEIIVQERAIRFDPANAWAKREYFYTIEAMREYAVGIGSIDALLPLFPSGPDHDLFMQKRQQFVDAAAKVAADAQPQP